MIHSKVALRETLSPWYTLPLAVCTYLDGQRGTEAWRTALSAGMYLLVVFLVQYGIARWLQFRSRRDT